MNERYALVIGSVFAACIVAAPIAWLIGGIGSGADSAQVNWVLHLGLTLPAAIAALLSSWRHTRGRLAQECNVFALLTRIVGGSFVFFVLVLLLAGYVQAALFAESFLTFGHELVMAIAGAVVTGLIGSVVIYPLALIAEYTAIRVLRTSRMRALLSGVDP